MGGAGSSTEECDAGTFDDDDDAMTACVAWQSCEPGTFVSEEGGATSDRVCTPCFEGTYTDQQNQAECLVSEECPDGSWVAEPSL
jgi:chitodextrinase